MDASMYALVFQPPMVTSFGQGSEAWAIWSLGKSWTSIMVDFDSNSRVAAPLMPSPHPSYQ